MPLAFTATNVEAATGLFPLVTDDQLETELIKFQSSPRDGAFTQVVGPQAFIVSSRAKREGEGSWPDVQIVYEGNLANRSTLMGFDVPQVFDLS